MPAFRTGFALISLALTMSPTCIFAASHREAPITALDRSADITDFFAFVSYDDPTKVTFIMNVDPLLEPANGPNYFPFDPNIVYAIHIDNTYDAVEDISFEFKFTTNIRSPEVFTGFVGALDTGVTAPSNAPAGTAGQLVVPPQITALNGTGSDGLSLQQTFTVTMVQGAGFYSNRSVLSIGKTLVAVPSNVGPRTMPNYNALAAQGIYDLGNGVRVFAGTVDDPFYIDLGATFDSLNYRASSFGTNLTYGPGIVLPVLTSDQDANDGMNYGPDSVAGYNVNTIAIEVPISMVTNGSNPVIGTWATTARPRLTIRPTSSTPTSLSNSSLNYAQVQRMGNPLINELIIGTGSKDMWSMSAPAQDSQFSSYDLSPLLANVMNAVFGLTVPDPPRTDLLPLVEYVAPIAGPGTPAGPIADLLRLNTSIPPTPMASRKRLGFIAGDSAGFPNGRRVTDDVVDIALRAVAGIFCSTCTTNGQAFDPTKIPLLGDGINVNDIPTQETFPYVAFAHNGVTSTHAVAAGSTQCSPNCVQ